MRVWYFSEFYTYSLKVLSINARGLRKINVRANAPDECNLITVIYCVEQLIVPVLINENLNESSTFLNDNHACLSQKNIKSEHPFQRLITMFLLLFELSLSCKLQLIDLIGF